MKLFGKFGNVIVTLFLLFCLDGVPHPVFGSNSSTEGEISKRQRELESIRKEIEDFEKKIQESRKSEQESISLLENLDRQTVLVKSYIRDLRVEEQRLVRDVDEARRAIRTLENEIEQLRTQYARYVRSAYRHGTIKDIEILLTAQSVNQFLVRAEYLRRFSDQRRHDLRAIQEKQHELQLQHNRLEVALREQRNVIREKQQEEKRLADRTVERRNVLNRVRQDRSAYETELVRKQEAEQALRRVIANLIEQQQQRERRDADRVRDGMIAEIVPPSVAFVSKKGSLAWPVRDGQIAARFGEQVHPVLKTVTENTGVDISVPAGSPVYAVAEGDVNYIYWMPAYGNIVIIYHYDGYRTVYANLSDILVRENDRVNAGDMIARSGESISGSTIHFEIWKDREKQNPEVWLQPQ
jgi:murein hydrolase activator